MSSEILQCRWLVLAQFRGEGSRRTSHLGHTIAKLLYASSAWIGFTKATDRQRVDGFLRRSIRSGYVRRTRLHLPNSVRLWMNNYLITFVITRITYCTVSFLHLQQPHKTTVFDRELTANNYRNIPDILTDSNFITHMLFTDIYKLSYSWLHRRRCKNNCT